jgi:uncharacterized DUF497 family protein
VRQQRIHWDAENTRHILVERAERKISKAEVEEVLLSGDTFRALSRRGGGRFLATGYTSTGRQLVVVFSGIDDMRPVTAWAVGDRPRRKQR